MSAAMSNGTTINGVRIPLLPTWPTAVASYRDSQIDGRQEKSNTVRYVERADIVSSGGFRRSSRPGLWEKDEKPPQRAVSSIVIMDLATRKIVKELLPDEGWIYPVIIDTRDPARQQRISGTELCWVGARRVVIAGPLGVDSYDVESGPRMRLVQGGSRPQCLTRGR
jgi:hypothetical protein